LLERLSASGTSLFSSLQVGVDSTSATLAFERPGSSFQIVDPGGDLVLEYVVVPEPGAVALAAIGLAAAWAARRRARRPTPSRRTGGATA
jgi:hypothetical protein